jgi:hypothetical protein
MTTGAELEHEIMRRDDATRLIRSPGMQAYCATLGRFTSSVQTTEIVLRENEAAAQEERERRELAAETRLRGLDKARAEAAAGLEHAAAVRESHGLGSSDDEPKPPGWGRPRPSGSPDLGIALTTLARRRDQLQAAETSFEEWADEEDLRSMKIVIGVTAVAGLIAAAMIGVVGAKLPMVGSLTLLVVGVLAVAGASIGVAVTRRLPQICSGACLARVVDPFLAVRFGAMIAGGVAGVLIVVNIMASSLS